MFLNIQTKKPIFSIDVIWLNKTNSQHMGINQVDFTSSVEEETIDSEDDIIEEEEGLLVTPQPITTDGHIEHQSDRVTYSSLIPVPYPKNSR
jgi:hypothetical protein